MRKTKWSAFALYALLIFFAANSYGLIRQNLWFIAPALLALFAVHVLSARSLLSFDRLLICRHGVELLILFLATTVLTLPGQTLYALRLWPINYWDAILTLLVFIFVEATVFWHGILCIYCTSVQMGIRYRMWGIFCSLIPVVNVVILIWILRIVIREIRVEEAKQQLNERRRDDRICDTRYPILLVHGFFFRDSRILNYWGRIPGELERNGAVIFYGEHQSAAAIADSAQELEHRVHDVLRRTGAEKVNIIAHSKGGLDCRYAMDQLGMAPYVASLTTVSTPHRGCIYADYLLEKLSPKFQDKVANAYNALFKRLGDHKPDFLAAARDLSASGCQRFEEMPVPEGVFCQSVGSVLEKARRGNFPFNATYGYVKKFDGVNDGLVAETAFEWGEKYTLLKTESKRGISHTDMTDLNRENLPDFDVREFYVQLVADLKARGF